MDKDLPDPILTKLIRLTGEVSRGQYDNARKIFELTKTGHYPDRVTELAESFGMMLVQIEAREYRLEQMIEDLHRKNAELEETLRKVELLENIRTHLCKFVPESVKRIIEARPDSPDLEKHKADVSILFLDIAGYTRMSESVPQDRMNELVETYFSSFLDHIHQNKGDINETAGDGLMIIFQDADSTRHAHNAVSTALAIHETTEGINQKLAERSQPVTVNIGINSGTASVGSTRFEGITGTRWTYTASGPVTNVAARIGSLARDGEILIGEETAGRIRDTFPLESRGCPKLKNVQKPIEVFRVMKSRIKD
ncbi:MAG: adenylate/guanylate cyclase domain-containing protein [Desulfobacteraceae bacterium]